MASIIYEFNEVASALVDAGADVNAGNYSVRGSVALGGR